MWTFEEEPWQYRVLDRLPPGVDEAQLARTLAMTPSERLDAAIELMRFAEELRGAVAGRAGG